MNRVAQLEQAFRRIAATRMRGMEMQNPALHVEAVGFRAWQSGEVGVLITPWSINLVVLPAQAAPETTLGFPSGVYDFMRGSEPECGPFLFASLFSPPAEFATQDAARDVAIESLRQLFAAGADGTVTRRGLLVPPANPGAGAGACTR